MTPPYALVNSVLLYRIKTTRFDLFFARNFYGKAK